MNIYNLFFVTPQCNSIKMQIINANAIVHSNYVLIVWFSTPHMSNAIDGPYRITSQHVSYKHLRYDGSVPSFVPQIYGYCRR